MAKYLSIFILTISLCSLTINCLDFTDAMAYNNCFDAYVDGTLCPAEQIACDADAQCTAAKTWDWTVCAHNCPHHDYTYLGNTLSDEEIGCSKNCDKLAYDHNFTSTASQTKFKNSVDCYSVCYHFLAGFRLESIFTALILLLVLVFKLN